MIKVLYISDCLKKRFGVTSVICNYISNFPHEKIQVDLLVYDDSEQEIVDMLKEYGCNVYFMPRLSLKNILFLKKFAKKFFNTHKYDIVHSHFNQLDNMIFPIAKKKSNSICISHSHNTKLSDHKIKAIRNKIMCHNLIKRADYCAACSYMAGVSLYGKSFLKSQKKFIIKNGVDTDKYQFNVEYRSIIRNELNIKDDEILIGHVGSFKLQKNHTFIIDFFEKVVKDNRKYKLLLVGDGELLEEIKSLVEQKNIKENVIFAGVRNDINMILSAIDLFILPSLYEGLPVVGIEAQASGVKCIFSSTISDEVNICNNVFLDIDKSPNIWADYIKNINYTRCNDSVLYVNQCGYNLKTNANELIDFYLNIIS